MNFMKYPTKNDISISNAVLKLAKLQNAEGWSSQRPRAPSL